jgi:Fe-S-cluster containining protein
MRLSLEGNRCMIYKARPKTCRDFPYVERYKHLTGYHPHSLLSSVGVDDQYYQANALADLPIPYSVQAAAALAVMVDTGAEVCQQLSPTNARWVQPLCGRPFARWLGGCRCPNPFRW